MPNGIAVKVEPWGPDQAAVDAAIRAALEHELVRPLLRNARYRLLAFEFVGDEKKTLRPRPPVRYRATFYDYTNNRAVIAEGRLRARGGPEVLAATESAAQPLPNHEEFDAAIEVLLDDAELGPAIRDGVLRPYRPMPPLVESEAELPDGRVERTLAVGLLPAGEGARHEIVGVNMIRHAVVRFESGAPLGAEAHNPICGLPDASQPTASRGTAGQVRVTVSQGNTVLWRFTAVRPAASRGTNGAGIELWHVDYRGKRVLFLASVPILNVLYDSGCGPSYRDWQYEEGMLQTPAAPPAIDVAPGFRLCPSPAQTILDTGIDQGNFLGVAVYVQGLEAVLVSELQAGWYRYVSEWRFHADGTIRPRFGLSAVSSSCVCNLHHHHVYWRFDFDIRTAGNNRVLEFNDAPIVGSANWHTKSYEIRRRRSTATQRKWRVENTATGEAYELIPGPSDGAADAAFGVGDFWAVRYRGSSPPPAGELEDGQGFTTDPALARANLGPFVNGESIANHDVVVWYAAHFTHDTVHHPGHGHTLGPELRPVNW